MKKNTKLLLAFFYLLALNCFSENISHSDESLISSSYIEIENKTTNPVYLSLQSRNISKGALINVSIVNDLDEEINIIENSQWVFSGKESIRICSGKKKSFVFFTKNSEILKDKHRIKIAKINVSKKIISENEEHSIPVGEIEAYINYSPKRSPIITLTKIAEFESYIQFEYSYTDNSCVKFTIS
jgi:hypothetical protein